MDQTVSSIVELTKYMPFWANIALLAVVAASAITALTPTPKDDKILRQIYRLLEIVALNIGHAKDK